MTRDARIEELDALAEALRRVGRPLAKNPAQPDDLIWEARAGELYGVSYMVDDWRDDLLRQGDAP